MNATPKELPLSILRELMKQIWFREDGKEFSGPSLEDAFSKRGLASHEMLIGSRAGSVIKTILGEFHRVA